MRQTPTGGGRSPARPLVCRKSKNEVECTLKKLCSKHPFLLGFLSALLMVGLAFPAVAATMNKTIEVVTGIRLFLDDKEFIPQDANGNPVEVFLYNGTTYLPVRAISSAFGRPIQWDGETSSVYIGNHSSTGDAGTRSSPLDASAGASVTYNAYSFQPTRQVKLSVLNTITGDAANYLASKASSANETPTSSQEWLFFEVELNYISSSKGENDVLIPSNILNERMFFNPDGSALGAGDDAFFSGTALAGYNPHNEMYPGSTSKVLAGILVNKGYDKVLLKVPNNSDSNNETNTWVHMNSTGSTVISAVDDIKVRYNIDQGGSGNHENDPIQITLTTSLPTTISRYSGSTRQSSASITDFSYTVSGSSVTLTFTGEKTYDVEGSGQSRAVNVGWKLYDSDGYVVKDGTARSTSIKMGEKFKNCQDSLYGLEPGAYTMEIMNVN